MLAVSHSGDKVFLHKPEAGLAVPVLLNLVKKRFSVVIPSPHDLENHYWVFEEADEAVKVAGQDKRKFIKLAESFSRIYSVHFSAQIRSGKLTIASLRKLVEQQHSRQSGKDPAAKDPKLESVETRFDEIGLEFAKPAMVD